MTNVSASSSTGRSGAGTPAPSPHHTHSGWVSGTIPFPPKVVVTRQSSFANNSSTSTCPSSAPCPKCSHGRRLVSRASASPWVASREGCPSVVLAAASAAGVWPEAGAGRGSRSQEVDSTTMTGFGAGRTASSQATPRAWSRVDRSAWYSALTTCRRLLSRGFVWGPSHGESTSTSTRPGTSSRNDSPTPLRQYGARPGPVQTSVAASPPPLRQCPSAERLGAWSLAEGTTLSPAATRA
mmetsp:Transcript_50928/g.91011  ORF Transcript_50928/g.91011 Transcript_50928/m.91011 type:complete len:239 (+) Transcript_50928:125-841(+)